MTSQTIKEGDSVSVKLKGVPTPYEGRVIRNDGATMVVDLRHNTPGAYRWRKTVLAGQVSLVQSHEA